MPDVVEPTPTPDPQPTTLTSDELRDTIGDEVDARMEARGLTIERLARLDLLDNLEGTFKNLFAEHTTSGGTVDEEGLLKKMSDMIDGKLKGLGGGKPDVKPDPGTNVGRKVGPLGRFLAGNSGRN